MVPRQNQITCPTDKRHNVVGDLPLNFSLHDVNCYITYCIFIDQHESTEMVSLINAFKIPIFALTQ